MKMLLWLFAISLTTATAADVHPNYDDDVKPILRRYCFQCHSASEARSGLNLEAYAGVQRGGSSGEAIVPGRSSASLLYQVIAQEKDGVPRMPFGGAKLPDPLIATVREWIELGAPEHAKTPIKAAGPSLTDYRPTDLNRPT
ncbi:MAG TPA: c-type cytochrome domain-containing protein, partial [Bryobacteraceae bacterium]